MVGNFVLMIPHHRGMDMISTLITVRMCDARGVGHKDVVAANQQSRDMRNPSEHGRKKHCAHNNHHSNSLRHGCANRIRRHRVTASRSV